MMVCTSEGGIRHIQLRAEIDIGRDGAVYVIVRTRHVIGGLARPCEPRVRGELHGQHLAQSEKEKKNLKK